MQHQFLKRISPVQVVILGFLALILGGTVLLLLPISTYTHGSASFMDALFTATSATCVTGLVVQDTASFWSPFGQVVILLLIQVGGMGVVTMAMAVAMLAGRRIGLKHRFILQEAIAAPQVGGIVRVTGFLLKGILLIEGIGALLLALRFVPQFGFWKGLWYAVFHAISAFCNAGFDLMGRDAPFSSLLTYRDDWLVTTVIMALIVLGGLGFLTWSDVKQNKLNMRAYRFQTKLILLVTATLLLGGTLFFFFCEFSQPQWAQLSLLERLNASLFQAVSPRTAGFNTVDLTKIGPLGVLLTIALMLIGGSPGSTAGGFKTTTLGVLLMNVLSVVRRRGNTQAFGRRLPEEVLRRASAVFLLYLILFLLGATLLNAIDAVPLQAAFFESASALATVGLSLGITPSLSVPSQLILIFLMYLGRVGGLTLIFAVAIRDDSLAKLPQEQVTVG